MTTENGLRPCWRAILRRIHGLVPVLLLLLAGCSDSDSTDRLGRRSMSLADVPASVRAAAEKQLPDVTFADAWKNVERDGKLHSYEIRGKNNNGKTREVRVSPSGDILEVE